MLIAFGTKADVQGMIIAFWTSAGIRYLINALEITADILINELSFARSILSS
jgi:hypothetical protein